MIMNRCSSYFSYFGNVYNILMACQTAGPYDYPNCNVCTVYNMYIQKKKISALFGKKISEQDN